MMAEEVIIFNKNHNFDDIDNPIPDQGYIINNQNNLAS